MNFKNELAIELWAEPVGTTISKPCPICGGDGRKSFYATKNESGIVYLCHRVSCGAKGFIPLVADYAGDYVKPKSRKLFEHETVALDSLQFACFRGNYGLSIDELLANRVVYCPSRGSFVFPVMNYSGFEIGKMERWYSWWQEPPDGRAKAIYYTESEAERVHFPADTQSPYPSALDPLYICEDILSAIKVSRIGTACALLGTHLSHDTFRELMKVPCSKFVLLLDPDAFGKAVEIQNKFGLLKPIEVVYLDNDPKDTPEDELRRVLLNE